MEQSKLFYDPRFLESWAGSIVTDPATAIVELVANCWDAYATNVEITWPNSESNQHFKIVDNGKGMTKDEFEFIWRTMSYNRINTQGKTSKPPDDVTGLERTVFGKNGKGRFASFCFSDSYLLTSRKSGQEFVYRIKHTNTNPLDMELISFIDDGVMGHGTEIVGDGEIKNITLSSDKAKEIIGNRFLANPSFAVFINGTKVSFNDINNSITPTEVAVEGYGRAKILLIDSKKADKSTKQHGIAWWVQGRAVGECKWSGSDYSKILDGRTSEAKRFTFIIQADFLNESDAVLEDWSGFKEGNNAWIKTREVIQQKIRELIIESNRTHREEKRTSIIERVGNEVNRLTPLSKDRVETFVTEVVDSCPNLGENEIVQLTTILTKLEKTKSKYGLLEILHNQDLHDFDSLHEMLSQWTIGMAKIVLDEIQTRLKLISELREKIKISGVDEVHELQPLFEKGLWMFGPQFESIEYTSNKGMTTVIRELFKDKLATGSRNRPDFVVLPDSSIGLYARPSYDDEFNENGTDHLVIVDLKTTKLPLGSAEKEQVWKYVKELKNKGYIKPNTKVDGFILGDVIEPGESEERTDGDYVKITPILYDTILIRAEKRLLNLHGKVQEAPFLIAHKEQLQKFTQPLDIKQIALT